MPSSRDIFLVLVLFSYNHRTPQNCDCDLLRATLSENWISLSRLYARMEDYAQSPLRQLGPLMLMLGIALIVFLLDCTRAWFSNAPVWTLSP